LTQIEFFSHQIERRQRDSALTQLLEINSVISPTTDGV
jgi:hypothetical protein